MTSVPPSELDPTAVRSAQLFAAKVVGNLGYFAAVLLLARGLGPEGRGQIAFLIVSSLILARLAAFGVVDATTIFAARRPAARGQQLATAVGFAAIGSVLASVGAGTALHLFGGDGAAGISGAELAVLVAATVAAAIADVGYGFLLGCDRIRDQALITSASSWLYPFLLVVVYAAWELTVVHAAIAWAVAHALRALWALVRSIRGIGLARPSARLLRESLAFGSRAWVGTLSRFLNFRVDQVLMGFLATESALGIYAVAVNASEVLLYLPSATAVALLPLAARSDHVARVEVVLRAFRSSAVITLATLVFAALLGPPLLPLLFGSRFESSVGPFLWLLPGALGFAALGVFSSGLVASSFPGRSSLGPLTALVVGLGLASVLIPAYGATGAAAAASAAFLAGGAAALLAFRRRVTFSWSALLVPRAGDLDVLRALAAPLRRPRPAVRRT
jgi:O-antigen/teichoic acid export membrane protein